jgi:glycosyltransferase involved in cell wall biosynthesis
MRILVHDYAGHPLQVQLSRELARRGHDVVHAFFARDSQRRGALMRLASDPPQFRILAVRLQTSARRRGVPNRLRHEIVYGAKMSAAVRRIRPDVVLSANAPLLVQRRLLWSSHRNSAAYVYWLQDRIGVRQSAQARRRLGALARPAVALIRWLERSSLAGADGVVAITSAFLPALIDEGVARQKVAVVPNWGPVTEIEPLERRNRWAIDHALADETVFMYAGSLGLNHNPQLLVELARALPAATVVLVSDGRGVDYVRDQAATRGLTNIRIVPVQPYELLPSVLASADVVLAVVEPDSSAYSVPSKLLTYLCAGRAILASVPFNNLAATVIADAGAGIAVEPTDVDAWLASALELASDPARRAELGRNGRSYAERAFSIEEIGDQFEEILLRAVADRAASG